MTQLRGAELREAQSLKRTLYMRSSITHQQYYEWLADELGITMQHVPAKLAELQASTDEHFNDIPIWRWDACHAYISTITRGLPWSPSDTVCVLKAVARRAVWAAAGGTGEPNA